MSDKWHDPMDPSWPSGAVGLEHDPAGDVWAKHTDAPERDPDADRATRRAIRDELGGEYAADGMWQPSSWQSAT